MILNMRIGSGSSDNSAPLDFTYTGEYRLDGSISGDWTLTLLTSGTLTFYSLGTNVYTTDVFLVGGGGNGESGSATWYGGAGGGSGYTTTLIGKMLEKNTPYTVAIGGAQGTTSAFGLTAAGGSGKSGKRNGGAGCEGGFYDATWGYGAGVATAGTDGEYAFGDSTFNHALGAGYKFAASGGGGAGTTEYGPGTPRDGGVNGGGKGTAKSNGGAASVNSGSGGGGCGGGYSGGAGGSGIVIIRNTR